VARDLLPIGVFASRCRLSVKALRHYDELGLLQPAHVDAGSGYRYYGRDQAPVAIAIALLRSLDVPLTTIRDLLDSRDPAAISAVLARERERRAREISRAESALRSIERLMKAGAIFPYDVTLREEPGLTALVVEGRTTAELHVPFGKELVRRLLERLERLGRRQDRPGRMHHAAGATRRGRPPDVHCDCRADGSRGDPRSPRPRWSRLRATSGPTKRSVWPSTR
jgi:DNA-binding transcriptional MerR regulator